MEQDRIGFAGYLALALPLGVNAYGFVRYGDGYMLMWVVASLYFYMFYWILPLVRGAALVLLHRKEFAHDRPAPEPRGADPLGEGGAARPVQAPADRSGLECLVPRGRLDDGRLPRDLLG